MNQQSAHRALKKIAATVVLALLTTVLITSCGSKTGSGSSAPPAAGDLVTWSFIGSIDPLLINAALNNLGIPGAVTSSVPCYRLTYRTPDPQSALVSASGLVCLPAPKSSGNPMLSYQHGTIFQNSDAPSNLYTSPEALVGVGLAALGYIVVMPDYLGYGSSTGSMHPFLHAPTLADASVNMNRAARLFLATSGVNASTNGQLFLAGYSEGGYATLATQRLMEQSLHSEFAITASEPGAGPYDLSGTAKTILGLPQQPQPAFSAFFLKAYDSLYNASSRIDVYFAAPYADAVKTHFDGAYSLAQIDTALGGSGVATDALYNPAFITDYLGTGETQLKADIAANDIYDWAPAAPTRLFQGVQDDIVPYANTTTAKAAMDSRGAKSVTVADCNAGTLPTTHDNCVKPYALDMLSYFNAMVPGL